jgi:hypothetical protein
VLRDGTVFCPLGGSVDNPAKIACYSITPRTVSVSLPSGRNATEIAGATLYSERRERASTQLQGGCISIALEARRPVILYRNKGEARSNSLPLHGEVGSDFLEGNLRPKLQLTRCARNSRRESCR